ncbi:DnaJ domain-containing protein [Halomonas sp.]|uniref:DnaJ domain-containing protein n=1 Tax=Halomonas sp. TaxID=1486246 RepID=UPI0038510220
MSISRFSPFELLLLQSRCQVDTATLLLLAWVIVNRQSITDGQRRRRLAQVTANFCHGHELLPVMQIAQSQDLHAIQLASEVLRKECSQERSLSIMHQSITVATDDGNLSLANHYILRFLADLLGVMPDTLSLLFEKITEKTLSAPDDISTDAYWRRYDPQHYHRKAKETSERVQAQARTEEAARRQQEQQQQRKQEKQHHRQEREQAKQRRRQEREQAKQRRRQEHEQKKQERELAKQHRRQEHEQKKQEREQAKQHRRQQHEQEKQRRRQELDEQARAKRERSHQEKARQREKKQQDSQKNQRDDHQQHQHQQHTRPHQSPYDRTSRALAVLGLTEGATPGDIRRAYRRMAQHHHPDRFFSKSEQQVMLASARFQRIKNAYDYLKKNDV